ncbi:MAG: hypothetical protein M3R17_17810 [Bacteroidota bacterium]|nr:hypothetical protein [Bacteroidota bacterium]
MKRPLLFAITAIALLYAVRAFEYAGIRRNAKGEFAKLRQTFIDTNNFDLLVIGSSRAECEFYTPMIDSLTGLHSFNIGMIGSVMPFTRATLEAYLVHSSAPQYVVLNLDLHSLSDNPDTVYNFPRYFAFLENEKLYEGLKARDKRFFYFKHFPVYSMPYYTSRYFNSSLRGWAGKSGKYDADYTGGFAPHIKNDRLGDLDTMTIPEFNHPVPALIWQELKKIVQICREKKIKLILTTTPLFHRWEEKVVNYQQILSQFRAFAYNQKLPFIDLSHDSIRFSKELYADPAHLAKPGALLFTSRFCADLRQYLLP